MSLWWKLPLQLVVMLVLVVVAPSIHPLERTVRASAGRTGAVWISTGANRCAAKVAITGPACAFVPG